jgi:SPP1 family predicted phage head-tail adaptor
MATRQLNPGDFRHRVQIQRLATSEDTSNAIQEAWLPLATVWAAVEPMSAREQVEAQSMQSAVSVRIRIRPLAGVDAACRVIFRGQTYNVHGVIPDPVSGLEWWTLPCSVGNSPG